MLRFITFEKTFLTLIFISYFFFGLHHISQFMTADEHYWVYERIPQYWNALAEGKWPKTLINDKPGVSLALVSGIGLLAYPQPDTLCLENQDHITICNNALAENILFAFRFPLLIVNGLFLFYIFWIIRKISDSKVALFATLFMALSPILIGMTQIVNPDTILWSSSAAAIFSFLALLKLRHFRYLFLTGTFLAFAILSKYTASFLLPFFFALSLVHIFFGEKNVSREMLARIARQNLSFFFATTVFALAIGFLFLPAAWVNPSVLLRLFVGGGSISFPLLLLTFPLIFLFDIFCFGARLTYSLKDLLDRIHLLPFAGRVLALIILGLSLILIIGRIFYPEWALFEKVPFDLKDLYSNDKPDSLFLPNHLQSLFLELNPLLFSLTPIALLFFAILLIKESLKKMAAPVDPFRDFTVFSLLFFFFSFLCTLIFSEVLATSRYLIMLYPIVSLLAAFGVRETLHFLVTRFGSRFHKRSFSGAMFLFVFSFSLVSLSLSAPFYFNYTNILLPKDKLVHHAWGYGGYEAAQYLNTLPGADKLTVWADYYGVCEFFVGRCIELEYQSAALAPIDYVVVSARGKALYKPEHSRWKKEKNFNAAEAYKTNTPLWELLIHNRPGNFVRVNKQERRAPLQQTTP